MVAPVPAAALHPLTPGSPLYATLKVGAIGALVALRFVLVRRNKHGAHDGAEPEPVEVAPPVARPHPVSKKKKRRKRRG
jgi:hypothetical protein